MEQSAVLANPAPRQGERLSPALFGADAALRRGLIGYGATGSTLQDRIDAADLALALGHEDAARLLYAVAFIQAGFAKSGLALQRVVAERTGLFPTPSQAKPFDADFALDLALSELRALVALEPGIAPTLPDAGDLARLRLPLPLPFPEQVERPIDAAATAGLIEGLFAALRDQDVGALAGLLDEVHRAILSAASWELADYATGPIGHLAAAAALNDLRRFFRLNHDLCWAPYGSPALFAATARLNDAALGPYLTGVGRLLRRPKDLFGLLALAGAAAGGPNSAHYQRWLVLLATHLDQNDRIGVADEAGDRGLMLALRGLLDSTRRTRDRGTLLYWVIRDAGIDNGDILLAAEAQAAITRLSRGHAQEWVVMAEILGTGGADELTDIALGEALRIAPGDEGATERRAALREGSFARFHALVGYGSPGWRVALRARNRTA